MSYRVERRKELKPVSDREERGEWGEYSEHLEKERERVESWIEGGQKERGKEENEMALEATKGKKKNQRNEQKVIERKEETNDRMEKKMRFYPYFHSMVMQGNDSFLIPSR